MSAGEPRDGYLQVPPHESACLLFARGQTGVYGDRCSLCRRVVTVRIEREPQCDVKGRTFLQLLVAPPSAEDTSEELRKNRFNDSQRRRCLLLQRRSKYTHPTHLAGHQGPDRLKRKREPQARNRPGTRALRTCKHCMSLPFAIRTGLLYAHVGHSASCSIFTRVMCAQFGAELEEQHLSGVVLL